MSESTIQPASGEEPPPPDHPVESTHIYRREAIAYHTGARHQEAHLIQLVPRWALRMDWVLLAVCAFALIYAIFGRVNEYARGSAVIESSGRMDVRTHVAGTIEEVAVRPGERVASGQLLVRLHAASEAAELARIDKERENQLVSILGNPDKPAEKDELGNLQAERDQALARLEERLLRATQPGIVRDIRVRSGQKLVPGDLVMSLTAEDAGFRVIAVLPGRYQPLLRVGMPLRLELPGFPYTYRAAAIASVSNDVVGPAEVRRYLPPAVADALESAGHSVVVEAWFPVRFLIVDGSPVEISNDMLTHAEVAVRTESILITLVPGLRAILGDQ